MPNLIQRLAIAIVAAITIALSLLAARWTIAAADLLLIKRSYVQLVDAPDPSKILDFIEQRATHAIQLQPLNADLYAARAYAISLFENQNGPPAPMDETRQTSTAEYLEALRLRPGSGHLWSLYAETMFRDHGDTPPLRVALGRSALLAPLQHAVVMRELKTFMQLVQIDADLSESERERLGDVLALTAQRSKKHFFYLVSSADNALLLIPFANKGLSAALLTQALNAQ